MVAAIQWLVYSAVSYHILNSSFFIVLSASNYNTPFGGSQGLLWNRTGSKGFASSVQNPLSDTVNGNYQLLVTEKRNGCTAVASNYVDFTVLAWENPVLRSTRGTSAISYYLTNNGFGRAPHLIVNTSAPEQVTLVIHNITGAILYRRNFVLQKGRNDIALPYLQMNQLQVISLYINNKICFTAKVIP
jgi:hypothetical protein